MHWSCERYVSEFTTELELALDTARAAGALVMRWFRQSPAVRYKTPAQPVTDADVAADRLIRERLLGARPSYGWLSEESGASQGRLSAHRVWIVDSIDGTRSFVAGRPEFAISLGLVEDGEPVLGVVLNPAADEVYWAVRDGDAFAGLLDGSSVARIHLRQQTEPPTVLASRSEMARGEFEDFGGATGPWRVEGLGSTAFKLARLAAGRADAYISRGPMSEWDVCAAALIVERAGGIVTDAEGRSIRYNRADPALAGCVAAAPALHARALAATRRAAEAVDRKRS
jgi:myo-inositol-1(or 4)-monophosphatase